MHKGVPRIVKLLLQNGADENAKTKEEKSVLGFAGEGDFTEIINLLTE